MSVAVVTIAAGRHAHLRAQREALARSDRTIDLHVVVAMDDPQVAPVAASVDVPGCSTLTIDVPRFERRLPLARARNAGARAALARGANILIFLDVDCLPSPRLVERYIRAVLSGEAATLCSGPVAYLPPPPRSGYEFSRLHELAQSHPDRPIPADDRVTDADPRLFWTLSFAIDARAWRKLGGFHEEYSGYGAEDTDFGQIAVAHGMRHVWVGGAWAYHQYHPSSNPPVEHLHDILRNASIFRQRWGWWPMTAWLDGFQRLGLVRYEPSGDEWISLI